MFLFLFNDFVFMFNVFNNFIQFLFFHSKILILYSITVCLYNNDILFYPHLKVEVIFVSPLKMKQKFLIKLETRYNTLWSNKFRIMRQQVASLRTANNELQANKFECCRPTSLWVASLQVNDLRGSSST